MRSVVVCLVVSLLVGLTMAVPPLPGNTTACGYAPTDGNPCGPQCPRPDPKSGLCGDSCGHACTKDSECGTYPWSPCWTCAKGRCSGPATFGHCPQTDVRQPGTPEAPVLPMAWNASFSMTNYTDPNDAPRKGFTWYDYSVGGLRQDFLEGQCPFLELNANQELNPDKVKCSVLFYQHHNYYVYLPNKPDQKAICCKYGMGVWTPDSYRLANASYGGKTHIAGSSATADWWRLRYGCPWTRPQPKGPWPAWLSEYTVQRDLYTIAGTNIPLQMNETLTSGATTFHNVMLGGQDTQRVFADFLAPLGCLSKDNGTVFDQTCNKYNARGRLGYLGFA